MQSPIPYGAATLFPRAHRLGSYPVREPPSDYLPSSPALDVLRRWVRRPLSEREPCTYRRSSLDRYQPNATRYLPSKVVTHLHLIGTTLYHRHPPGAYARAHFSRLAVDLALTSNRLEGRPEGEPRDDYRRQTQAILNHATAISWLLDPARDVIVDRPSLLNLYTLLNSVPWHRSSVRAGLRAHAVSITESVYIPPAIPAVIEELFTTVVDKAGLIEDPFEQAFFLWAHLSYLHPFAESHPRTARVAANLPLIRHNLVPIVFLNVSEDSYTESLLAMYEHVRLELLQDIFIHAYEQSCRRFRTAEGHKQLI